MSAAKTRALASIQMMSKLFDEWFAQSPEWSALPTCPINEVFSSTDVSACSYLCVTSLTQLLSEPFK
jgi:hypothetical protein